MSKKRKIRDANRTIHNIRAAMLIITLMTVVSTAYAIYYRDSAVVNFVSVGQGDATLITTPGGRRILIDAGPYYTSDQEKSTMADYLFKNAVWNLDIVVVSHYHADHYGGLVGILQKYNTKIVFLPLPQTEEELEISNMLVGCLKNKATKVFFMKKGESIEFGENIELTLLYHDMKSDDANDRSLVMTLRCFDTNILFTGDITFKVEEQILKNVDKSSLDSDIAKVAHHGSKYSSSSEFYDAVTPMYSVVQVGGNMFGHPTEEALERISATSEVYRTDENGTITFYINNEGIRAKKMY